jgi:hypothetical protein
VVKRAIISKDCLPKIYHNDDTYLQLNNIS